MRLRKDAQAPRIRTSITPPQREESPESRRLFGAVWGAQPQRTPRGKHSKANAVTQKRTLPRRLRSPRPFVSPSGSPPENAQARSEPTKPDNHATSENARMAIPTHGGIGTEHPASRPVWRYASNSRRDPTAERRNRNGTPRRPAPARTTSQPELKPAKRNAAPAHNSLACNNRPPLAASVRINARSIDRKRGGGPFKAHKTSRRDENRRLLP